MSKHIILCLPSRDFMIIYNLLYIHETLYTMSYISIEHLVKALADARKKASITQHELGKSLMIPQGYISEIENGKRDLRASTLLEIARTLGYEVMLIPRSNLKEVESILENSSEEEKSLYQLAQYEDD